MCGAVPRVGEVVHGARRSPMACAGPPAKRFNDPLAKSATDWSNCRKQDSHPALVYDATS